MLTSTAALAIAAAISAGAALAEDAKPAGDTVTGIVSTGDKALDELLAKEKESRKACKIDICSALRSKKPEGADISCNVVQTLPKVSLDKLLEKGHVSWPWENVHCQSDIKVKRAVLVSAMTQPKYEAAFEPTTITCDIERGPTAEKYVFKVSLTPKVTFENGKATASQLQWGELDAPLLAKGVLWPITGIDNKTGMLSGKFSEMINGFASKSCDEVKDQLKAD
jgi:hypothetical protein